MFGATREEKAYVGPFIVFLAIMFLGQIPGWIAPRSEWWVIAKPGYWVIPLQTVIGTAAVYGEKELGLSTTVLIATILLVQFVAFGGAHNE